MKNSIVTTKNGLFATPLFYIQESVVAMREQSAISSKVVSQAIFAEEIVVKKESEDWTFIQTSDNYSGWVPARSIIKLLEPYDGSLIISRLQAHVYGVKDIEYGPIKTLPYGSKLSLLMDMDSRWMKIGLLDGREGYIQKGDVAPAPKLQEKKDLIKFSQNFIGLPYTWGGRSSFGYDCSGFVQMLYSQIGILLERDSKQQVLDGRFQSVVIGNIEQGDLVFFGKSEDKIMHVGLCMDEGKFIHATARENKPWLRISHLTDFEWSGHGEAHYPYRTFRQLIKRNGHQWSRI